jgi:type IV secretion system protein TrbL
MVFELFALGVTAILFRDNLGELFAGFSLKMFLGGVYFWFINNAGTDTNSWPMQVITMFRVYGLRLAGLPDSTPSGTSPFVWLGTEGVLAAGAYIAAGVSVQTSNLTVAALVGFWAGPGAAIAAAEVGQAFTYMVEGMGLMILMATAAIWLQVILVTVESYIVMGAGIIFIGFAGSRFTLQFAQGYFSYMLNVGVKFMVIYIILAIEQPIMHSILGSAAATLLAAVFLGSTPLVYLAVVPAAVGLVSVLIAAGLVWMIPGMVGSFLNGQSSASGSAVLSQAVSSMAAASSAIARQVGKAAQMPPGSADKPTDAQPSSGTHGQGVTATAPNVNAPLESGHHLVGIGTDHTNFDNQRVGSGAGNAAKAAADEKRLQASRDAASGALNVSEHAPFGLSMAGPRDIGQSSAVQVRLGNPDKL